MKLVLKIVAVTVLIIFIISIIMSVIAFTHPDIINKFENFKTSKTDIIMFIDPTSLDSIKMLGILGREKSISKISIIDVSSGEGKNIVNKNSVDISTLPYFMNIKNGSSSSGVKKGINEITQQLK